MTKVPNDARRTKATSKCSTCGHEWPSGQDGTHLCETKLLLKIEKLENSIVALRSTESLEDFIRGNLSINIQCSESFGPETELTFGLMLAGDEYCFSNHTITLPST